ncbi:hypothetical protein [Bdellovibrio bacteriovorus]|uniref:hypothetical protein n=1 Tax=Bdellovibrio bacteriovorus TaxID=959 RepID=UPI00045BE422|nr:hypothetical protein [Bdellovibrio bacteriovorus]AHZ86923.1 hypothetical protein EP01_18575 [Bdellovibrio bacteriovorus]BEV67364.1 hypothetical protein Bb109J_c0784 [Bdellovibrio bacteriovorus]
MKTTLLVVLSLAIGIGISWAGMKPFAVNQFADGTTVETILVRPEATETAIYQIKQSDGVVCYAISGARNTNTPTISCIK